MTCFSFKPKKTAMKIFTAKWFVSILFLAFSLTLTGCDLVGDVLEFGFWLALIIIAIVGGIIYFIARLFRGKKD
jgi:hypothetical protein